MLRTAFHGRSWIEEGEREFVEDVARANHVNNAPSVTSHLYSTTSGLHAAIGRKADMRLWPPERWNGPKLLASRCIFPVRRASYRVSTNAIRRQRVIEARNCLTYHNAEAKL